jgi:hypothetical protein
MHRGQEIRTNSPFTHIGKIVGESEDSHGFGSDRDIESGIHSLALFSWSKSSRNVTEVSVVGVDNSVPSYLGGVDVEANELAPLLFGQVVRVRLRDAELLETLEHDRSESANALLGRTEAVEEGLVGLSRFVEVTSRDGGGEQVVRSSRGVNVTWRCQNCFFVNERELFDEGSKRRD